MPPHNIDALLKYLQHRDWPLPNAPVGRSRHLGRIAEWVVAIVSYNQVCMVQQILTADDVAGA